MSMFSTFRDPFRSTFEDILEVDPWISSLSGDRTRVRRGGSNRMISCDTFETDQEFKVICEVSDPLAKDLFSYTNLKLLQCPGVPKEKLDVNVDNFLLTVRVNKQAP